MPDDIGQWRDIGLTADAEARTKVIPEDNPKFFACLAEAEEPVTAVAAHVATSAATDFSFGYHAANVVFGAIGVERDFGTFQHLQQLSFVGVQTLE